MNSLRCALLGLLISAPAMAQGPPSMLPPGPPPPGARPISPPPPELMAAVADREAELLSWLSDNDPESLVRLERLRDVDPRGYMNQLVRVARLIDRAKTDPEMLQRHKEIQVLEVQIRGASSHSELLPLVDKLFDLRQEERRATLVGLEGKIDELRQEIERRDQDRANIVSEYIGQVLDGAAAYAP